MSRLTTDRTLPLILATVGFALAGCGSESAPLKDTSASVPRPAPGTPTKDVMIPAATAGGK